jgi:hypothetical protein
VRATSAFRDNVIHPHIFQQVLFLSACVMVSRPIYRAYCASQDGKSLEFLYYLDFLRACPRDYSSMTSAFSSAAKGGPPAIKITSGPGAAVKGAQNEEDYEE